MARGYKTGGRVKGTPNLATVEVSQRLADLQCDPLAGMAQLAMDEANPPELRGRMYAELAGYQYPKRKAVELVAEVASRSTVMVGNARSLASTLRRAESYVEPPQAVYRSMSPSAHTVPEQPPKEPVATPRSLAPSNLDGFRGADLGGWEPQS